MKATEAEDVVPFARTDTQSSKWEYNSTIIENKASFLYDLLGLSNKKSDSLSMPQNNNTNSQDTMNKSHKTNDLLKSKPYTVNDCVHIDCLDSACAFAVEPKKKLDFQSGSINERGRSKAIDRKVKLESETFVDQRKSRESPTRKVSFKIRSNSSVHRSSSSSRRNKVIESRITISPNIVAELTTKFNALTSNNNAIKAGRSVEVLHTEKDSKRVLVFPQSKKPSSEIKVIVSRKISTGKRDAVVSANTSVKLSQAKKNVDILPPSGSDKVFRMNSNGSTKDPPKRKPGVVQRPSLLAAKTGNVKATIQIFEKNATIIRAKPADKLQAMELDKVLPELCDSKSPISEESSAKTETKQNVKFSSIKNNVTLKSVAEGETPILKQSLDSSKLCENQKLKGILKRADREVTLPQTLSASDTFVNFELQTEIESSAVVDQVVTDCQNSSLDVFSVTSCNVEPKSYYEYQTILQDSTENYETYNFYEPVNFHSPKNDCATINKCPTEHNTFADIKPNPSFLWRSLVIASSSDDRLSDLTAPELPPKNEKTPSLDITSIKETCSSAAIQPRSNSEKSAEQTTGTIDYKCNGSPSYLSYSAKESFTDTRNCSTADEETLYDDAGVIVKGSVGIAQVPCIEDSEGVYECCANPSHCYEGLYGDVYQCIEDDNHTDSNIYDEVKSVNFSNCYESIYQGSIGTSPREQASSGASSGNNSSCDRTNSLYGIGGYRFDSASVSQASTVSADDSTLAPHGAPRSETSDEWMDLENSESEHELTGSIFVVQERLRGRRSPRWSHKVRKQWTRSLHRPPSPDADSGDNSTDHETNPHYEKLHDVISPVNNGSASDDFEDSFDSDDSTVTYMRPLNDTTQDIGNGKLPDPPPGQNINGISKIAEAAGKKMIKFGKSLRKIRVRNNRDAQITGKSAGQSVAVPPTSCFPMPTPFPPSVPERPALVSSNFGPPSVPLQKTASAYNLTGRKYWSLRKFRRSMSAANGPLPLTPLAKKETAQFYVSEDLNSNPQADSVGSSQKYVILDVAFENANRVSSANSSSGKTQLFDSTLQAPATSDVDITTGMERKTKVMSTERKTYSAIRPNSPPPLPPTQLTVAPKRPNRKTKEQNNTSWYADCGLFDKYDNQNTDPTKKIPTKTEKGGSHSWYAEVGLWDRSSSTNESSLSEFESSQHTDVSDSSTSQENSTVEMQRRFMDEPLYQFYTASVAELAQRELQDNSDSDGYEEIGNDGSVKYQRPSAMELIKPRDGHHRTLWCEIPEVINCNILNTLTSHQKKLQEAKFEIVTSEASYVNSLNVLENHFIGSRELNNDAVLSKNDRRILFANVLPVKQCSEKFLAELEKCWQDNILLHGICDIIFNHATNNFNIYIKYCSNQIYLDRTLRRLKEQHGKFAEVLVQLESSPVCQSLSLHSFLMLPMQRITRLPLLVDAVLTRIDPNDDEFQACKLALATLNKVVQECNEGARRMERMEEILILHRQLDFPREIKPVPIISSTRWLVKSGELIQLMWRGDEAKLTFGKKFSKISLHGFLFTDLLVITKKKSDDCYTVVDYCPRNLVQMVSAEEMSHLPVKFASDGGKNLLLLTMLQNHEKKTVEMVLSCSSESDRQRWLEAVSQPTSDNPDERVYEEWDCPQVTAVHPYVAQQPDELSLDVSDVVNVLRKMADGWYQGERIRDGERGWFPGNYSVEVASAHIRAKNLKQRYRLLALSGKFLEAQRKEKLGK